MTRIKRLFGGFSFGWFLIVILKCISFCDRRAKVFKAFCEYICSVLDREVRCSKYRSRSQSSPSCLVAARLNYSSDTIIRLNFKKEIKVEIEPKILLRAIAFAKSRKIEHMSIFEFKCFRNLSKV